MNNIENLIGASIYIGSKEHIPLPLGISFYTFLLIGYQIEIFGGLPPVKSLLDFTLYVSFWPKIISGPIVRPDDFLPQLETHKIYERSFISQGSTRILHGLFKKIVIADNLGPIVDGVFSSTGSPLGTGDIIFGIAAFGLQLYFDFSGYTDIAIGSARLLGYELPENFDNPYKSASFSEFWMRWHITLSSWIRDYIYMPLMLAAGGNRSFSHLIPVCAMVVFGFWHGASWTFALWGVWHGIWLVLQNTSLKKFFRKSSSGGAFHRFAMILLTYVVVNIGWLFFKASDLSHLALLVRSLFGIGYGYGFAMMKEKEIYLILFFLISQVLWLLLSEKIIDVLQTGRIKEHYRLIKPAYYSAMVFTLIVMERSGQGFIYFKF